MAHKSGYGKKTQPKKASPKSVQEPAMPAQMKKKMAGMMANGMKRGKKGGM